jgi:hypothetical protein
LDLTNSSHYIGKTVLVGVTYQDAESHDLEKKQFFGTICRINQKEGIVLTLSNTGKEFSLPPALDALKEARPGEYRLRSTGEIIVDPDYLTTWISATNEPHR